MGRRMGIGWAAVRALPTLTAGGGGGKGGRGRSIDVGAVLEVGEEGPEEMLRQWALARRVAAFEIADDGSEGWEGEARLSDAYGEGLGGGCGSLVGLGMGPFDAEVVGHALQQEMGVAKGHFALEAVDAVLEGGEAHGWFTWGMFALRFPSERTDGEAGPGRTG